MSTTIAKLSMGLFLLILAIPAFAAEKTIDCSSWNTGRFDISLSVVVKTDSLGKVVALSHGGTFTNNSFKSVIIKNSSNEPIKLDCIPIKAMDQSDYAIAFCGPLYDDDHGWADPYFQASMDNQYRAYIDLSEGDVGMKVTVRKNMDFDTVTICR